MTDHPTISIVFGPEPAAELLKLYRWWCAEVEDVELQQFILDACRQMVKAEKDQERIP